MTSTFTPLDREGLLHIAGPDTLVFLQGQTTCDTDGVSAARAVPGIYCTPKGRTVADFLLVELGEDQFALRMRKSIIAAASAVLGKYIVFSKADIQDPGADWQVFACWGDDAGETVAKFFGGTPNEQYACISGDGFRVIQMDETGNAFECYLLNGAQANAITEHCDSGDPGDWEAMQIDAGIARIESETVEEFIPQMLNYDLTGFISFTKGCYTGQEVVARLHYRGTPKRRSYAGTTSTDSLPAPGTALFVPGQSQSVGNIVNACRDSEGELHVLVSATSEGAELGLRIGEDSGAKISLAALPYSLTPANS